MKLNIGCGKQTWDGFFCVDAQQHPKATRDLDLKHAFEFGRDGSLANPLPLPDACAQEVHCYHFIEHIYAWESPNLLREFQRLLVPRGLLILELPDLELAARNLLAGQPDQMGMWPIYGDWGHKDPYMMHKHGYTRKSLKVLLGSVGFTGVAFKAPKTHGARANRDMRAEAYK